MADWTRPVTTPQAAEATDLMEPKNDPHTRLMLPRRVEMKSRTVLKTAVVLSLIAFHALDRTSRIEVHAADQFRLMLLSRVWKKSRTLLRAPVVIA
jgi:hypothetical protein